MNRKPNHPNKDSITNQNADRECSQHPTAKRLNSRDLDQLLTIEASEIRRDAKQMEVLQPEQLKASSRSTRKLHQRRMHDRQNVGRSMWPASFPFARSLAPICLLGFVALIVFLVREPMVDQVETRESVPLATKQEVVQLASDTSELFDTLKSSIDARRSVDDRLGNRVSMLVSRRIDADRQRFQRAISPSRDVP